VLAGLGYILTFSTASGKGVLRAICPLEWMAVNRIKDSIGKIRFNETNLILFFNNSLFFLDMQSICRKKNTFFNVLVYND
jgi:hypothetical protein